MSPSRSIANKLCKIAENMVLTWIDSHFVCDITQILTRRLSECTETGEHFFEIQSTRRNWSKAQHRTKKKSQRNINKRDTYTGEICCRAEEKKIEYALWIDTEIADDNLTSSHDNLFSQHFLTFIVSLYLCLYLFCSAVCYAVLLLGLFFCSHRDLLITVFCAGKLMFVQKAWT